MATRPRARNGHRDLAREIAMLDRYARHPTAEMREAIVRRFMPLARRVAIRYADGSEPLDDLVQVAALGLVKAVDRYDASRGSAFSSYAVPTIAGELKRYFRDRTWAVHVPRDTKELALRVEAKRRELERTGGASPTVGEIAAALDVDDEQVLDALRAASAKRTGSLDAPLGDDHDSEETAYDRIGADDVGVRLAETRAALAPLVRRLPTRSRLVLRLRFEDDLTQREIGDIVGVSQMQVSRILREALQSLREAAQR